MPWTPSMANRMPGVHAGGIDATITNESGWPQYG
jgi:hypothetical protein